MVSLEFIGSRGREENASLTGDQGNGCLYFIEMNNFFEFENGNICDIVIPHRKNIHNIGYVIIIKKN